MCNADDASKFTDTLHFVIKDGEGVDVVLKAKGEGPTIYCVDDLNQINMGVQYTHRQVVKEIFIQNKGRKAQKITWQRKV